MSGERTAVFWTRCAGTHFLYIFWEIDSSLSLSHLLEHSCFSRVLRMRIGQDLHPTPVEQGGTDRDTLPGPPRSFHTPVPLSGAPLLSPLTLCCSAETRGEI